MAAKGARKNTPNQPGRDRAQTQQVDQPLGIHGNANANNEGNCDQPDKEGYASAVTTPRRIESMCPNEPGDDSDGYRRGDKERNQILDHVTEFPGRNYSRS